MSLKGKIIFNEKEMRRIQDLLIEKVGSDQNGKKSIRDKIRGIGFYISDFRNKKSEFTLGDFNELVEEGKIKIINS